MKIHVVQKGETLWKISQKYGVDFEELKAMNTHLSDPDMIMPGMKIKIPSSTKFVKKEQVTPDKKKKDEKPLEKPMQKFDDKKEQSKKKEKKEESKTKQPIKNMTDKAMPVIKEDDSKKPVEGKDGIPMKPIDIPEIPMMEQHMEKFPVSINVPKMPHFEKTKNDIDIKQTEQQVNMTPQVPTQPAGYYMPTQPSMPSHPVMPFQSSPCQQQPMPMNYYYPKSPCESTMHAVPYALHHPHKTPIREPHGNQANIYGNTGAPYPQLSYNEEDLMESSSSLEMPQMPSHLAGVYDGHFDTNQPSLYPYYNQGYNPAAHYSPQGYGSAPQQFKHGSNVMPQVQMPMQQPYGQANFPYQQMPYGANYGMQQQPMPFDNQAGQQGFQPQWGGATQPPYAWDPQQSYQQHQAPDGNQPTREGDSE